MPVYTQSSLRRGVSLSYVHTRRLLKAEHHNAGLETILKWLPQLQRSSTAPPPQAELFPSYHPEKAKSPFSVPQSPDLSTLPLSGFVSQHLEAEQPPCANALQDNQKCFCP